VPRRKLVCQRCNRTLDQVAQMVDDPTTAGPFIVSDRGRRISRRVPNTDLYLPVDQPDPATIQYQKPADTWECKCGRVIRATPERLGAAFNLAVAYRRSEIRI